MPSRSSPTASADARFIADAKKSQLEVNWISGEKAQAHVAKMLATPQAVQDAANEATQLKGGVLQANLKWITVKDAALTKATREAVRASICGLRLRMARAMEAASSSV